MQPFRYFCLIVLSLVLFGLEARAQMPQTLAYQGFLTDNEGTPLDGPFDLTFRLYERETDGLAVWTETRERTLLTEGVFSVPLGSVVPLEATLFEQPVYLSLAVGDDTAEELQPRLPLEVVPYSLWAGALSDDALQAGDNVTLERSGNALVISATASGETPGWRLGGNTGTNPATDFIGTNDETALELRVDGIRALRIVPATHTTYGFIPNLIGGYEGNSVAEGTVGATISGGGLVDQANVADGHFATIAGGSLNVAEGVGTTVSGGGGNTARETNATVGGGQANTAEGEFTTIGGGGFNTASNQRATIGGGSQNTASASTTTVSGGRLNEAGGGGATIGGGYQNAASGGYSTISGGQSNTVSGNLATIGGGSSNEASGQKATIGGGSENQAGDNATVGGGENNIADGTNAVIGGGLANKAGSESATVGGGFSNTASGIVSTVAGGGENKSEGDFSTTGGGQFNEATGRHATVSGGESNEANGEHATVSGGINNTASGENASTGGGIGNAASGIQATIAGGWANTADDNATVSGGAGNDALGSYAAISGGDVNTASGSRASISGGSTNTASGNFSAICGGASNTASGQGATSCGGAQNAANGKYSFAAGRKAKADHNGAFVWADQTDASFTSTAENQFLIRAAGGVGIGTNTPQAALHTSNPENGIDLVIGGTDNSSTGDDGIIASDPTLSDSDLYLHTNDALVVRLDADGSGEDADFYIRDKDDNNIFEVDEDGTVRVNGTVLISSDRNRKEHIEMIDPQRVLEAIGGLPLYEWSYLGQTVRHVGPMAQDFYAAFQVGHNETSIATVDANGVALAAIQGLSQRVQTQDKLIKALIRRIEALEQQRR